MKYNSFIVYEIDFKHFKFLDTLYSGLCSSVYINNIYLPPPPFPRNIRIFSGELVRSKSKT